MRLDFNDNWIFEREGEEKTAVVSLPHDAMLAERREAKCRSGVSGAYFSGGKYRYTKRFELPSAYLGKSVSLLFEGVYRNARVFCNGKEVCFHAYGFTEFTADISEFIRLGENEVEVIADNSLVPNCRYYTGSGIYRPVTLIVKNKAHVKAVRVKTISYCPAVVEVTADKAENVDALLVEIRDGEKVIASGNIGRIEIKDAKTWSADSPKLYTCAVSCDGDCETVTFGIRKIEWNSDRGLVINGESVKLRGGCIHHDNGVLGACSYYDAEYRRVRLLKEQGFNALRISHNPASRYLLEACDKIGMYVLDEAFDGWYVPKEYHDYSRDFFDNYESDLRSMVDNDFNHPCVIMYSVGNEVTETASERGARLCAKMRDIIRQTDDTRPVTCGINILLDVYVKMGIGVYKDNGKYERKPLPENGKYREKKSGSAFFNALANKLGGLFFFMAKTRAAEKVAASLAPSLDVLGLNYASSRYDVDAKKYPSRLMLGTETMVADLPYNWSRVQKYPQLLGDFVWAAWDYLGEACIGDWTYFSYKGLPLLAGQGMLDVTGKPLAAMRYMQTVWGKRSAPFICVRPLNHLNETPSTGAWQFTNAIDSWSWQGFEGKRAAVEVFSNAYKVRLMLNGRRVGEKKIKKFKTAFRIRYRSGELVAVALDEKDKEISRSSLCSAENETILTVTTDKSVLKVGELCFAEIEFTDNSGNLKPFIEQRVEIASEGESARLLGFGSALCKTDEVFDKPCHDSYRGRCLAVFQAKALGKTTVTVRSAGVPNKIFEIEVTK